MDRSLGKFISYIPKDLFVECQLECRYTNKNTLRNPYNDYEKKEFHSFDDLQVFLVNHAASSIEILSIRFDFGPVHSYVFLDLLMGRLKIYNGLGLLNLTMLQENEIFGRGKLIEEIQIVA